MTNVARKQSEPDSAPRTAPPAENPAPESTSTVEVTSTAAAAVEPDRPALPQVFRIQKVAYFTVPMMLVVTVILAGASLVWLGWTMILPVFLALWIGRVRTVVTDRGLRAVHTFSTREIDWDDLAGLQFTRWGPVRAVLADGSRVSLPAVMFSDLPRLSAASGGRIPDPYAQH